MISYLMDEHIPTALTQGLRQREPGLVVWQIGDPGAPRHGTGDPEILRWCERRGFLLVTNNRESMPVHLADLLKSGGHVPGIITVAPGMALADAIEELALIAGAALESEFSDQIRYLPIL